MAHGPAPLAELVRLVSAEMVSEVCSIYLLREGMLELFATRGLSQDAVHVTRMALGEGLVGTIGRGVGIACCRIDRTA